MTATPDNTHTADTAAPGFRRQVTLRLRRVKADELVKELNKCGKPDLESLLTPLHSILKGKEIVYSRDSDEQVVALFKRFLNPTKGKQMLKSDYIYIYLSFVAYDENIYSVAATDLQTYLTWRQLLRMPDVPKSTLATLLGREITSATGSTWKSFTFFEALFEPLRRAEDDYYDYYSYSYSRRSGYSDTRVTLQAESREKLAALFLGDSEVEPVVIPKLPEGADWLIENYEQYIPGELAYLSGVAMTENPMATSGLIPAMKMRKISVGLAKPDPEAQKCHHVPLDRAELLCLAFFSRTRNAHDTDAGKFARYLLADFPRKICGQQFGLFLPAFKGFAKSWADTSNAPEFTHIISRLLKPAAEGWMSLDNFRMRILCSKLPAYRQSDYPSLFRFSARSKSNLSHKDFKGGRYEKDTVNWFPEVDFPFALHWLRFLCGLGLVELAIDKSACQVYVPSDAVTASGKRGRPKKARNTLNVDAGKQTAVTVTEDSLEGLRYVRLTPLGRYALGIDKKYVPSKVSKASFNIDYDDRSGVATIPKGSPFAMFLTQIAEGISSTRFRITPLSLIKGCKNIEDLEERIANLSRLMKTEEYPRLEAVISEARLRADCTQYATPRYTLIKVRPEVPGLVEFIRTNPEIRKRVVLAEQGIVLVSFDFYTELREILARHGYLIP